MFDIADDRRDDGTTMSQAPGRGAVPPPPPRSHGYPPPAPREPGQGYEPGGYETGGYEPGGYDTGGYSSGRRSSDGWPADAYSSNGHSSDGYSSGGYPSDSWSSGGYPSDGYSSDRYPSGGSSSSGFSSNGYAPGERASSGLSSDGWSSGGHSDGWSSPGRSDGPRDAFATGRNPYDAPSGTPGGWSSGFDSRDDAPRTTAISAPSGPTGLPDGVGLPTPRESGISPPPNATDMVSLIRSSFELVAPRADDLTQLFYGWLFRIAPETRELFPVTMELQRTRLLRALVHVVQMVDRPDELTTFLRQLGRDHRKFGVVGEHYDKVGEALVGAIKEFAGPAWTREIEQAWIGAYGIVSQAMRDAADAERGPAVWMARVMEHRRVSQDLAVVRVQTSQPVPYLAGQYVSVETPQRPRMWRSLSPANAPGPDCVLEFHVHTVPGGWVSRAIVSHAHVGDVWRIGPPMGQMTLDPRSRADLLMVAGGTGLAPARALVEQLMVDGSDRKVALFVGGRTWDSLYDIDTLRRMAQDNPWLTVVPVVEEDGRRYGAETGTLGEVVARYGAWADRQVVVSGSPGMVRSTVSAMLDAGTPFMQIHYDPYHTD
ncbi:FAD-binding oxidoreductase [Actinomycetospora sp. TBRC 11914]|uniref:FAD-binding oxidoreductase n=1 Tax=Actinomycetospora sp. TBRC 11914 TaxID=2729387 RepID=UPI002899F176|nr:FAD-binding oxidoreductase [Actinomycetospora sp. TBRC 11914]